MLVLLAALVCDLTATILRQIGLAFRRVAAWRFRCPVQSLVIVVLGPAAGRSGVLTAVLVSAARLAALSVGLVATLAVAGALVLAHDAPGAVTGYSAGAAVTGIAAFTPVPTVVRPLFLVGSAVCSAAVVAVVLAS